MSEQPTTVRTDELAPGDRLWHPFEISPFTVAHTPKPETGLRFEGEPGLRVTGTSDRGETVHVDVAPGYVWHRAPAAAEADRLESAVAELGALPMGVDLAPLELSEEQVQVLAAAGNRVVNDATHEQLCMCDGWPEKCSSTGNYYMGAWDVSGLEDALPAVLAAWEQMRGGEILRLQARVTELEAARQADHETWQHDLATARAEREAWAASKDQPAPLISASAGACDRCGMTPEQWCPGCAKCACVTEHDKGCMRVGA